MPDPGRATTLDEVAEVLRALKVWAGDPSFGAITARVNQGRPEPERVGRSTVVDCFRDGRRRIDAELLAAVVEALHPVPGYVNQWRQTLRVVQGLARASGQVRVSDHLPPEPSVFIGREDTVDRLQPPTVSVLRGMAGVGKTGLAVRLGHHLLRDQTVDRVMFVDLRGFHHDAAQPPADPAAVLDGFLRLLGVAGTLVPVTTAERIALYRERLAGRRVLVVLDNAADADQVLPLLPEQPGCVAVVTSRRILALPGSTEVEVAVFTPAESRRYLTARTGDVPVGDDPRALDRIAACCGHLPLALALVTGQMPTKPDWTLTDHADRLEEQEVTGRPDSGIGVALETSYRALSHQGRRLLRLLAPHPGQAFDVHAAAALAGATREAAADALAELHCHHVVQDVGSARFALHDLVREFAALRTVDEDRRADRRAAVSRLLDYYLAAAVEDMHRLDPSRVVPLTTAMLPPVELPAPGAPGDWLDTEISNLAATTRIPATHHDRPAYPFDLSAVLERYLTLRGHDRIALTVHNRALRAAQESGDVTQQARAVARIAIVTMTQSRHLEALEHFAEAERLYTACGDPKMQSIVLINRAAALTRIGRAPEARQDLLRALQIGRSDDDPLRTLVTLGNLGLAEMHMGLYEEALQHLEEAFVLIEFGDTRQQAALLGNLGETEVHLGRFDEAERHLGESLRLIRRMANKSMEAETLQQIAGLHLQRGRYQQAAESYQQATDLAAEAGDHKAEATARGGLDTAYHRLRSPSKARRH